VELGLAFQSVPNAFSYWVQDQREWLEQGFENRFDGGRFRRGHWMGFLSGFAITHRRTATSHSRRTMWRRRWKISTDFEHCQSGRCWRIESKMPEQFPCSPRLADLWKQQVDAQAGWQHFQTKVSSSCSRNLGLTGFYWSSQASTDFRVHMQTPPFWYAG
jgi:hypothetical protein